MKKILIFITFFILCISLVHAEVETYNYSIDVFEEADLNVSYLLETSRNITINATNQMLDMRCSDWIYGCDFDLFVEDEVQYEFMIKVPPVNESGIYTQNITFFNATDLEINPEMVEFNFNITLFFNLTTPINNITNTTNQTIINNSLTGLTSDSNKASSYFRAELPEKNQIEIKLYGLAGTLVNVSYDEWFSGPQQVILQDKITYVLVNLSIPDIAIGKYTKSAHFTSTLSNETFSFNHTATIKRTEYVQSKLVDSVAWDELSEGDKVKAMTQYWEEFSEEWLDSQKDANGTIIEKKPQIVPVNYEYMAYIMSQCDPTIVAERDNLKTILASVDGQAQEQLEACQSQRTDLQISKNLCDSNLANLTTDQANCSAISAIQEQTLNDYDAKHMKNSSGWLMLILGIGITLLGLYVKHKYEIYKEEEYYG